MKKTWIKVKRGLLDPKHIERLGQAWYLYLYILDQADWEKGIVTNWKDEYAADDLNKPVSLIREHRRSLEGKYIEKKQNQHDLTIIILNWSNPREYSGQVYNAVEGAGLDEPSAVGEAQGAGQGLVQGAPQGFKNPPENPVPSYSHITHNTYTQNRRIYTPHKSYQELKKEAENRKAKDYKRFLRDPYYRQVSND